LTWQSCNAVVAAGEHDACMLFAGLKQEFTHVATQHAKPAKLIEILRHSNAGKPGQRTLVFCHSAASVRFVEKYIHEEFNRIPGADQQPTHPADVEEDTDVAWDEHETADGIFHRDILQEDLFAILPMPDTHVVCKPCAMLVDLSPRVGQPYWRQCQLSKHSHFVFNFTGARRFVAR